MKRKSGDGTVCQRSKDGKWMGAIHIGRNFVTGKKIRRYVYGDSEQEVTEKLYKLKPEDCEKYIIPAESKISFSITDLAAMMKPCVYHLIKSGSVVYVGKTDSALQRIIHHYRKARCFGENNNARSHRKGIEFRFDEVVFYFITDPEERKRKERLDISEHQPIYNTLYTKWHREPFVEAMTCPTEF